MFNGEIRSHSEGDTFEYKFYKPVTATENDSYGLIILDFHQQYGACAVSGYDLRLTKDDVFLIMLSLGKGLGLQPKDYIDFAAYCNMMESPITQAMFGWGETKIELPQELMTAIERVKNKHKEEPNGD
jgi:hypothetical protein